MPGSMYKVVTGLGPGERSWRHVVCPEWVNGCGNDDWVTLYEPGTVTKCSLHRPQMPRLRMIPCPECEQQQRRPSALNKHVRPRNRID